MPLAMPQNPMKQIFDYIINRFLPPKPQKSQVTVKEGVEYSLKKYRKTYKLLEEYDQKAISDPEKLANAGRLRRYIQEFQKQNRAGRTNSSV